MQTFHPALYRFKVTLTPRHVSAQSPASGHSLHRDTRGQRNQIMTLLLPDYGKVNLTPDSEGQIT